MRPWCRARRCRRQRQGARFGVSWLAGWPSGDASRPSRTCRFASWARPDVRPMAQMPQAHKKTEGTRALRAALPRRPRQHCDGFPSGAGADRKGRLQRFARLGLTLMRHADTATSSSTSFTPSARPRRMQVESFRGETLRRTSRTRSRSRFIVNSSCRQRAGLPDPKICLPGLVAPTWK